MKIAQFTDSYPPIIDGVAYTALYYARFLRELGHECCVVAPAVPGYVEAESFPVYRFGAVPIPQRPPYRFGMPALDIALHGRMRGLELDLVHAHSPFGSGSEALRVARRRGIPLVASFHSKYWDDIFEATHSRFLADRVVAHIVRFYHRADSVWTVSDMTARTLRGYGYRGSISVVPNGQDMREGLETPKRVAAIEAMWGLRAGEPVFLYVGQMIWQKNLRLILDAFARYRETGGTGRLILVGGGGSEGEVRAYARGKGLDGCAHFPGVVLDRETLAGYYARADLFLFPSRYDNAPLVVREASAMGCPSLMVRGSHASQGTVEDGNAFLCAEDAQDMARAMGEAMGDRARLKRIGLEARRTLAPSWREIVGRVAELYGEVLGGR